MMTSVHDNDDTILGETSPAITRGSFEWFQESRKRWENTPRRRLRPFSSGTMAVSVEPTPPASHGNAPTACLSHTAFSTLARESAPFTASMPCRAINDTLASYDEPTTVETTKLSFNNGSDGTTTKTVTMMSSLGSGTFSFDINSIPTVSTIPTYNHLNLAFAQHSEDATRTGETTGSKNYSSETNKEPLGGYTNSITSNVIGESTNKTMSALAFNTTSSLGNQGIQYTVDSYRDRLTAFYMQHNPDKLSTVDKTLQQYKGREKELFLRLDQKYTSYDDPVGTGPITFLHLQWPDHSNGIIKIQLFADRVPYTAENFRCLCTGERGTGRSGRHLCYRGSELHRIVPKMCIQGGDITAGDGTGGESIFPPSCSSNPKTDLWGNFADEAFLSHKEEGLLSMANNGPNRNSSQFFITTRAVPHLNGKHVVFGKVIEGMDVIHMIENLDTDERKRPLKRVIITDCGEIKYPIGRNVSLNGVEPSTNLTSHLLDTSLITHSDSSKNGVSSYPVAMQSEQEALAHARNIESQRCNGESDTKQANIPFSATSLTLQVTNSSLWNASLPAFNTAPTHCDFTIDSNLDSESPYAITSKAFDRSSSGCQTPQTTTFLQILSRTSRIAALSPEDTPSDSDPNTDSDYNSGSEQNSDDSDSNYSGTVDPSSLRMAPAQSMPVDAKAALIDDFEADQYSENSNLPTQPLSPHSSAPIHRKVGPTTHLASETVNAHSNVVKSGPSEAEKVIAESQKGECDNFAIHTPIIWSYKDGDDSSAKVAEENQKSSIVIEFPEVVTTGMTEIPAVASSDTISYQGLKTTADIMSKMAPSEKVSMNADQLGEADQIGHTAESHSAEPLRLPTLSESSIPDQLFKSWHGHTKPPNDIPNELRSFVSSGRNTSDEIRAESALRFDTDDLSLISTPRRSDDGSANISLETGESSVAEQIEILQRDIEDSSHQLHTTKQRIEEQQTMIESRKLGLVKANIAKFSRSLVPPSFPPKKIASPLVNTSADPAMSTSIDSECAQHRSQLSVESVSSEARNSVDYDYQNVISNRMSSSPSRTFVQKDKR